MAGPVRIVRMGGSSIAAPAAAAWITDFLNAAYYARPADARDLDDLRLAHCVLTTFWLRRGGRRLGIRDLPAFYRCFGPGWAQTGGALDRDALLAGGARLLGDWFPAACADPRRRAHGVAFPSCTALHRRGRPLEEGVAELDANAGETLPAGARPRLLLALTSHRGHFL